MGASALNDSDSVYTISTMPLHVNVANVVSVVIVGSETPHC